MFFAWTIFNALFSVSSPLTFDGVEGQMNKGALGCQFFCHWSWDVWTCTCKNHISYRVIKVIGTKYFNQVMGIGIYYYCCCCLWYLIGIFHLLGILFNFVCLTPPAMYLRYKIKLGTTYLPSSARQNDDTESHISLIFTCLKLPTTVCVPL